MAGDSTTSGSVFRVGDNVELWRVIAMVSILVFWIVIFEFFVHKLEHHLKKYPKYHEMMTKVFGELMILGLIGLGIKIMKELGHLDLYSKPMIAFQAADLTIFIVAIGLIIQSIVIFTRIRSKNILVDKAELISTPHLVDFIETIGTQSWCSRLCGRSAKSLRPSEVPEVAKMRMLRHLFLKSYGLPEVFPFSKYLRQAQDNQISHMIEVKVFSWALLLLVAWGISVYSNVLYKSFGVDKEHSVATAYLTFAWLSVGQHWLVRVYFSWAVRRLLRTAVGRRLSKREVKDYAGLKEIAQQEADLVSHEHAADAIATMERVRDVHTEFNTKRVRKYLRKHASALIHKASSKTIEDDDEQDLEEGKEIAIAHTQHVRLPLFSRRVWHFIVIMSLMLNAFYGALFCQCVLFQMKSISQKSGYIPLLFMPMPLLINMLIFHPGIMRDFVLVSSIVRVDHEALGEVIDHFTDTIHLRTEFAEIVHANLRASGRSVRDIQAAFESRDQSRSGLLSVDATRRVLSDFGFKLSFFRFNSVAKLLFDLRGVEIEYGHVIRLLAVGSNASSSVETRVQDESMMRPYQPPSLDATRPPALRRTSTATAGVLYHIGSNINLIDLVESPTDGVHYARI